MKNHVARLALLIVTVSLAFVLPASAQILYENGPINGTNDGWTINFGFVVSDTFTISTGNSNLTGLAFGAWLFPGDTLDSVQVTLTSEEFGGTTYLNQIVNLTQSGCSGNQYGYNVCTETGMFTGGPTLPNGTYWLNMMNAVTSEGNPVYWDENDGVGCQSGGCPSFASNNGVGTLGSEAFSILGTSSGQGSVPEPGSLALFAGGVAVVAVGVRRRLF